MTGGRARGRPSGGPRHCGPPGRGPGDQGDPRGESGPVRGHGDTLGGLHPRDRSSILQVVTESPYYKQAFKCCLYYVKLSNH